MKRWTPEEDDVIRARYPTEGMRETARHLPGRTKSAVGRRASDLGVRRQLGEFSQSGWRVCPEIDAALRAARPTPERVTQLARDFNRPRWWMAARARSLGLQLPRLYGKPWTSEETSILRDGEDCAAQTVQRRLRAAGFKRSLGEINTKRLKLGIPAPKVGYSATELARLLGVSDCTVMRWIRSDLLQATALPGGRWRVMPQQVRAFFVAHPLRMDLRALPAGHQPWLIDVLTGACHG